MSRIGGEGEEDRDPEVTEGGGDLPPGRPPEGEEGEAGVPSLTQSPLLSNRSRISENQMSFDLILNFD